MLPEYDLDQVIISGEKDYVIAQEFEKSPPIEKGFNGVFVIPLEILFPVEDILFGSGP